MADQSRPRRRPARVLASGLFALVMAELAAAIAAALASGTSWADAVGSFTVTNGAMGLGFAACGMLLAWHRPRSPVGWLFLAGGVAYATSTAAVELVEFGAPAGWNLLALRLLGSLFSLAWPLAIGLCLPMALLLFPAGRPPSPHWRWLVWAIAVESLLFELMFAGPSSQTFGRRTLSTYLVLPGFHRLGAVWAATNIAWAAIFALVLASLVVRYRRGGDVERRQLLWLVLAVVVVLPYGHGLSIEVSDDGRGSRSAWHAGFGLTSMRERAAELGGSCEVGPGPDGGGRVTASLPLGESPAELAVT